MAQATAPVGPVDRLRAISPDVADRFNAMRKAIEEAGPLDAKHRELIMLAGFTTARIEGGFKTHCGRALAAGATPDEVRQAALLTLAATQGVGPVADALRWAEEVIASR